MFLSGPLCFLYCFWQTLFPLWEELAGKRVTAGGRTEREWLKLLKRREKTQLIDAVIWMGQFRTKAAVPELLDMLQNEQFRTNGNVVTSLAEIGPGAPDLIPGLLRILEKGGPDVRIRALEVLLLLEPEALQPLLPRLVAHLEKHHFFEAERTLVLIGKILDGTPTPPQMFKSLLQHRDALVRYVALACFLHRPELAGHVALVEERLQDADELVRCRASNILRRLAARGKADRRYFMQDLARDDWRPLYDLKEDLESLGPQARLLLPELHIALERTKGIRRVNVAAALWLMDGNLRALEVLLLSSRDANKDVSFAARLALAFRPNVTPMLREELRSRWLGKKRDPQHRVVSKCILALGKDAEPLLADALWDERREVRREALGIVCVALGDVRANFKPVLDGSFSLDLADQETVERELAPLIPPLLLRFCRSEQQPDLQYAAALLLWKHCEHPEAWTYLAELLDEEKVPVVLRTQGIEALPVHGLQAEIYQPRLLGALKSKHPELRAAAARRLGEYHRVPPPVIQALVDLLRDAEPDVQQAAAVALGSWGTEARLAAPELERLLHVPQADLRVAAIKALARVSTDDQRLRSRLHPLLEHGSKDQRKAVLEALCEKSDLARGEVPLLLQLLRDPDLEIRREVLYVLQRIGPVDHAVQEAVVRLLDDPRTRGAAAYTLRRAAKLTPEARAGLQQLLFHHQGENRFIAVLVLYEHTRNPLAFAMLRNGVQDMSEGTTRDAMHYMKKMGSAARVIKPELLAMLRQPVSYLAIDAATALWEIDRDPEALSALIRMMQEREGALAKEAAQELVKTGALTKAMEPALRKLLEHPSRETRAAARMVLERLAQLP
jgi:HEAT repeat protein